MAKNNPGVKKTPKLVEAEMNPRGAEFARGQGELGSGDHHASLMGELDDGRARVQKINEWVNFATEQTSKLRDRIIENFEFMSNKQYSDEETSYLNSKGRPTITINFATSIIQTVGGLQRRSRTEVKLLPFEPDDIDSAHLMEVLVKWVRDRNNMRQLDSKVFEHKMSVGLGFWKLCYDFRRRPQGDIRVEALNPLNVIWDPNYPDCAWRDAEWVAHTEYYTMDRAIARFPDQEEVIRAKFGEWLRPATGGGEELGDSQASKRSFWDPQTQRAQILEVWYKSLVKTKVAVFATGEVESDPDQVAAIEEAMAGVDGSDSAVVIDELPIQRVFVSYVMDDQELDHLESPYPFDEFPIIPSLGYYYWQEPFGLMDLMKDAQKEKNKRRMAIAEVAGRTARSGVIYDEGVFDDDQVENYFNGAGVALKKKGQGEYEMIRPPSIDQNLVHLEDQATKEIRLVVNVNDEVLGQTNSETQSGRAIEARQRAGLITQEPLFDSFNDEQAYLTELMIEMIKDNMTRAEAYRILGRLAIEDPSDPSLQGLGSQGQEGFTMARDRVQEILGRVFDTRYDVVVHSKPYEPSVQLAKFNQLIELGRQGMAVPPPILVQAAVEAGVVDKKLGLDWLQAVSQPALPAPGGEGGQGAPTSPEGVQASLAQQMSPQTQ